MPNLRERMELDLEARLIGETLVLNRSLNPFLEDYIKLNDLNEPFELRRNQGDDLIPAIEEGEVIEEFRTRDEDFDIRIDDYPTYCDDDKKIHIDCAHAHLKFSCMIGFITLNFYPLLYVNVMSRKFHNSIMKNKMVHKGDNVVGALMNVHIFVVTFYVMIDFAVLEDMNAYRDEGMGDIMYGEPFLEKLEIKAKRFEGDLPINNGDDEVMCGDVGNGRMQIGVGYNDRELKEACVMVDERARLNLCEQDIEFVFWPRSILDRRDMNWEELDDDLGEVRTRIWRVLDKRLGMIEGEGQMGRSERATLNLARGGDGAETGVREFNDATCQCGSEMSHRSAYVYISVAWDARREGDEVTIDTLVRRDVVYIVDDRRAEEEGFRRELKSAAHSSEAWKNDTTVSGLARGRVTVLDDWARAGYVSVCISGSGGWRVGWRGRLGGAGGESEGGLKRMKKGGNRAGETQGGRKRRGKMGICGNVGRWMDGEKLEMIKGKGRKKEKKKGKEGRGGMFVTYGQAIAEEPLCLTVGLWVYVENCWRAVGAPILRDAEYLAGGGRRRIDASRNLGERSDGVMVERELGFSERALCDVHLIYINYVEEDLCDVYVRTVTAEACRGGGSIEGGVVKIPLCREINGREGRGRRDLGGLGGHTGSEWSWGSDNVKAQEDSRFSRRIIDTRWWQCAVWISGRARSSGSDYMEVVDAVRSEVILETSTEGPFRIRANTITYSAVCNEEQGRSMTELEQTWRLEVGWCVWESRDMVWKSTLIAWWTYLSDIVRRWSIVEMTEGRERRCGRFDRLQRLSQWIFRSTIIGVTTRGVGISATTNWWTRNKGNIGKSDEIMGMSNRGPGVRYLEDILPPEPQLDNNDVIRRFIVESTNTRGRRHEYVLGAQRMDLKNRLRSACGESREGPRAGYATTVWRGMIWFISLNEDARRYDHKG
ncbi:hypothetical protein Tco_1524145 [Tanacetum coccineum]